MKTDGLLSHHTGCLVAAGFLGYCLVAATAYGGGAVWVDVNNTSGSITAQNDNVTNNQTYPNAVTVQGCVSGSITFLTSGQSGTAYLDTYEYVDYVHGSDDSGSGDINGMANQVISFGGYYGPIYGPATLNDNVGHTAYCSGAITWPNGYEAGVSDVTNFKTSG